MTEAEDMKTLTLKIATKTIELHEEFIKDVANFDTTQPDASEIIILKITRFQERLERLINEVAS